MSRIGKLPVNIPSGVKVSVQGSTVSVSGKHGELVKTFAPVVNIVFENDQVLVSPIDDSRFAGAMHGTVRSIINNMVEGVQKPFAKDLEIQGVGFKASLSGKILDLALGYSHPIKYEIPEGVKVEVKDNTSIHVESADKALVGKVAAEIKHYYPVEPYKGKGVRIVGEFVRRKEGKKSAK